MRLTEKQILKQLLDSADQYKPLKFEGFDKDFLLSERARADGVARISVENGPGFKALLEIVPVATPMNIKQKSIMLIAEISDSPTIPMIVAPFIGRSSACILADRGISWIDLCGNMRVSVPGKVYIERTGKKNKFPDTTPIKKIFEGTSSLVSRALLLRPQGFSSQYELIDFINSRNANITASTVSRVLKSLESDLLITRKKSLISVTDTKKLLQSLADGYVSSMKRKEKKSYRFSIRQSAYVSMTMNVQKPNYLASNFYAAQLKGLGATDEITIFVRDMGQAREMFDFLELDAEFGNFKLIETKNFEIWFNSVNTEITVASAIRFSIPVVDDIELYLEMMTDAPRGPKIAEQLKERILGANYFGK
ncbi:MAG: hypothetical protein IIB56_18805 [Planctomycetes bacterium]|nr:hypothetical protein [Planctomycetota bacterium]